uniref:Uncharacterized protein n=1 Tax=Oryza barthii TaxID=65489 RepID=A0A0D3GX18_9ORYZ
MDGRWAATRGGGKAREDTATAAGALSSLCQWRRGLCRGGGKARGGLCGGGRHRGGDWRTRAAGVDAAWGGRVAAGGGGGRSRHHGQPAHVVGAKHRVGGGLACGGAGAVLRVRGGLLVAPRLVAGGVLLLPTLHGVKELAVEALLVLHEPLYQALEEGGRHAELLLPPPLAIASRHVHPRRL